MIKISNTTHNQWLSTKFSPEELEKIHTWFDPILTKLMNNDNLSLVQLRNEFVALFDKVPNKSLTKIFLYQILVANGIVNDGIHSKVACSLKPGCPFLAYYKELYGVNDSNPICFNLKLCLFVPGIVDIVFHHRANESIIEIPKIIK